MKVTITFRCDHPGCNSYVATRYNVKKESWMDSVEKVITFGWKVIYNNFKLVSCWCDTHAHLY